MAPTHGTILELCVRQAGGRLEDVPLAARVCEFIIAWAMAAKAKGGPITMQTAGGFLDYWGKGWSRRSAYRHLADFRQVFPEHDTPQLLADALIAAADDDGQLTPLTPVAA